VPCFSANEITVLENRNMSTRKPYHFASENSKKSKNKCVFETSNNLFGTNLKLGTTNSIHKLQILGKQHNYYSRKTMNKLIK